MSSCVLCNRSFRSEEALKQHERNSPKHGLFNCKACNRSFGSQTALNQHQDDSPAHQKSRKDSFTTSVTSVAAPDYVPLFLPTTHDVRSPVSNARPSRHTTKKNTPPANPTFDLPFTVLANRMQSLALSDLNTVVAQPKIGRAHITTRQGETRTSFTFPELHQKISEAVAPEIASTWFNSNINAYFENTNTTSVMGKFTCDNKGCRKSGWSSNVVAIRIRGYPQNGYNAIVYNQHCDNCDRLGGLKLNEDSYVERIAYRLKTWAGVPVEQPPFRGNSHGPHDGDRCEGCKAGDCIWAEHSK